MNQCPDCGYLIEALDPHCLRCRKYGPPSSQITTHWTPVKAPEAALRALLLFVGPALFCALCARILPGMWRFQGQGAYNNLPLDLDTVLFAAPLLTGAALGTYAAAVYRKGIGGAVLGMIAMLAWFAVLYLCRFAWVFWGPPTPLMNLLPALTFFLVLIPAAIGGILRANRIPSARISPQEIVAATVAAMLPIVGFAIVPFVKSREPNLETAALWGAVFGCFFWSFRILHP